jgi:glutamyl-tRNA synthetase
LSPGDQEIFTRDEMIRLFDLDKVSRSAANFDIAKLAWVNQQHMMRAQLEELAPRLAEQLVRRGRAPTNGPPLTLAAQALRERSKTTAEMADQAAIYYGELGDYGAAAAAQLQAGRETLTLLLEAFTALAHWTEQSTQRAVEEVAARAGLKLGKVAQPLRAALTGQTASPPIGTTLVLVGRKRSLERISRALRHIDGLRGDHG